MFHPRQDEVCLKIHTESPGVRASDQRGLEKSVDILTFKLPNIPNDAR